MKIPFVKKKPSTPLAHRAVPGAGVITSFESFDESLTQDRRGGGQGVA